MKLQKSLNWVLSVGFMVLSGKVTRDSKSSVIRDSVSFMMELLLGNIIKMMSKKPVRKVD